jgi:hypothetical protein
MQTILHDVRQNADEITGLVEDAETACMDAVEAAGGNRGVLRAMRAIEAALDRIGRVAEGILWDAGEDAIEAEVEDLRVDLDDSDNTSITVSSDSEDERPADAAIKARKVPARDPVEAAAGVVVAVAEIARVASGKRARPPAELVAERNAMAAGGAGAGAGGGGRLSPLVSSSSSVLDEFERRMAEAPAAPERKRARKGSVDLCRWCDDNPGCKGPECACVCHPWTPLKPVAKALFDESEE